MFTTLKLLELVKKTHGNCTNYRAAKLLDISLNTPRTWESRGSVMDDETAIKAAVLCNLNVEHVLACIAAERAIGTSSEEYWASIARLTQPKKRAA